MYNAPKKVLFKRAILNIVSSTIGILLGFSLINVIAPSEDDVAVLPLDSLEYPVETVEDMQDMFIDGTISITQMQHFMDDYIGFEADFTPVDKEDVAIDTPPTDKAVVQTIEMKDTFTAYLNGLFIQRNKINNIIPLVKDELTLLEEVSGEPISESNIEVINLASPTLSGVLKEIYYTPLYIHVEDGAYSVWVDYEQVKEKYNNYLVNFHIDLIELHRDVMRFGYTRTDGEIDANVIYNRLRILDDIQGKNRGKNNFYWEHERFQLVQLLIGYGKEEKVDWDETRIKQMEQIVTDSGNSEDVYVTVIQRILKSMEEEGSYGEETNRIANQWVYHEFKEYREHLEESDEEGEQIWDY